MLQLFWTFLEFHVKPGIILFLVVRKLRLITMIYIVHLSAFCWFQTEDVRMHEIMKYAHAFLQSFCLANAPNQALLHQYLELFLTPGVRPIMFNLCIRCISRLWYTVIIIKGWISDRKVLQKNIKFITDLNKCLCLSHCMLYFNGNVYFIFSDGHH